MSAVLISLCLALSYIASRNTYWILKVFAGFFWWALAFYWVQLPASTNASLQTILVVIPIGLGIACFFWSFWFTTTKNGIEIGKFKIPFINDSDEENVERNESTRIERNNIYRERIARRMGKR